MRSLDIKSRLDHPDPICNPPLRGEDVSAFSTIPLADTLRFRSGERRDGDLIFWGLGSSASLRDSTLVCQLARQLVF